jgi:hypothetical protein
MADAINAKITELDTAVQTRIGYEVEFIRRIGEQYRIIANELRQHPNIQEVVGRLDELNTRLMTEEPLTPTSMGANTPVTNITGLRGGRTRARKRRHKHRTKRK